MCILICTTLLTIFDSGCTGGKKPSGIFDYTRYPAVFHGVFPSESGDVECEIRHRDGVTALSFLAPERSSAVSVEIGGNGCVITSPVDSLSLSDEACRGLTSVFDLLYRGELGVESVKRSSDGVSTVVTYSDGTVILGEDGLPISVISPAMNGEMRTVLILGYTCEKDE